MSAITTSKKPSHVRRAATVLAALPVTLFVLSGVAMASTYTDPASVITPAGTQLKTDLLAVAGGVAVLGVVILGVKKGWRIMRGFF